MPRRAQWVPEVDEPPASGRPHTLTRPFLWPGTNETVAVGEAIPRWIRTTGCTWDEALARVGVSYRTAERWMKNGGTILRDLGAIDDVDERDTVIDGLDGRARLEYDFYVAVAMAAAEVVVRWQAILESEGRGGYPITRTTEKFDADQQLIERTVVTETARPNWEVIKWKMGKQLDRYRERPLVFIKSVTSPVELPEPTDDEAAEAAVASLMRYRDKLRADRAIPAEASEAP